MELTRKKERLVKQPCDTCIYEEGSRYCVEHCPYEAKTEQEPCEVAQMSLDDAIKHAEEVADREEKKIVPKEDYQNMPWIDESNSSCLKCSQEHRQLAEWLRELKAYKEQEPCNDAMADQKSCETTTNNDEPIYINYPIITCDDIAKERYKDLCEYFGEAKDILKSRKEFKTWLERIKWHIHKAEELYEKYEYKQKPCDAISREEVIDVIWENSNSFRNNLAQGFFADKVKELSSVQPSRNGRYVNIDDAIKALCPHDEDYDNPCISPHNLEIVLEQLCLDSGIKEKLSRKGRWLHKEITDNYRVTGQCSECKERRIIDNFCSNCGADMRGNTE